LRAKASIRIPVFRPVPTDLGAGATLASRLHHPDVLAISSAGRDFDFRWRDGLTAFGPGLTMLKIRLATKGVALSGRSLSPSDKAKLAGRLKLPGGFCLAAASATERQKP